MNWQTVWLASTNAAPAEDKQQENDMVYEINDRDVFSCDEKKLFVSCYIVAADRV